jgi:hypothetical protein
MVKYRRRTTRCRVKGGSDGSDISDGIDISDGLGDASTVATMAAFIAAPKRQKRKPKKKTKRKPKKKTKRKPKKKTKRKPKKK